MDEHDRQVQDWLHRDAPVTHQHHVPTHPHAPQDDASRLVHNTTTDFERPQPPTETTTTMNNINNHNIASSSSPHCPTSSSPFDRCRRSLRYLDPALEQNFLLYYYEQRVWSVVSWVVVAVLSIPCSLPSIINPVARNVALYTLGVSCLLWNLSAAALVWYSHEARKLRSRVLLPSSSAPFVDSGQWLFASPSVHRALVQNSTRHERLLAFAFAGSAICGSYLYVARMKWCVHPDELYCESMISADAFFLLFSILPVFLAKFRWCVYVWVFVATVLGFFLGRLVPFSVERRIMPEMESLLRASSANMSTWDAFASEYRRLSLIAQNMSTTILRLSSVSQEDGIGLHWYVPAMWTFAFVTMIIYGISNVLLRREESQARDHFEQTILLYMECKKYAEMRSLARSLVGAPLPASVSKVLAAGGSVERASPSGQVVVLAVTDTLRFFNTELNGPLDVIRRLHDLSLLVDGVKRSWPTLMKVHSVGDQYMFVTGIEGLTNHAGDATVASLEAGAAASASSKQAAQWRLEAMLSTTTSQGATTLGGRPNLTTGAATSDEAQPFVVLYDEDDAFASRHSLMAGTPRERGSSFDRPSPRRRSKPVTNLNNSSAALRNSSNPLLAPSLVGISVSEEDSQQQQQQHYHHQAEEEEDKRPLVGGGFGSSAGGVRRGLSSSCAPRTTMMPAWLEAVASAEAQIEPPRSNVRPSFNTKSGLLRQAVAEVVHASTAASSSGGNPSYDLLQFVLQVLSHSAVRFRRSSAPRTTGAKWVEEEGLPHDTELIQSSHVSPDGMAHTNAQPSHRCESFHSDEKEDEDAPHDPLSSCLCRDPLFQPQQQQKEQQRQCDAGKELHGLQFTSTSVPLCAAVASGTITCILSCARSEFIAIGQPVTEALHMATRRSRNRPEGPTNGPPQLLLSPAFHAQIRHTPIGGTLAAPKAVLSNKHNNNYLTSGSFDDFATTLSQWLTPFTPEACVSEQTMMAVLRNGNEEKRGPSSLPSSRQFRWCLTTIPSPSSSSSISRSVFRPSLAAPPPPPLALEIAESTPLWSHYCESHCDANAAGGALPCDVGMLGFHWSQLIRTNEGGEDFFDGIALDEADDAPPAVRQCAGKMEAWTGMTLHSWIPLCGAVQTLASAVGNRLSSDRAAVVSSSFSAPMAAAGVYGANTDADPSSCVSPSVEMSVSAGAFYHSSNTAKKMDSLLPPSSSSTAQPATEALSLPLFTPMKGRAANGSASGLVALKRNPSSSQPNHVVADAASPTTTSARKKSVQLAREGSSAVMVATATADAGTASPHEEDDEEDEDDELHLFQEERRCLPYVDNAFRNEGIEAAYVQYLTELHRRQQYALNGTIGSLVLSITAMVISGVYSLLQRVAAGTMCPMMFVQRYLIRDFALAQRYVHHETCDDLVRHADITALPTIGFALLSLLNGAAVFVVHRFGTGLPTWVPHCFYALHTVLLLAVMWIPEPQPTHRDPLLWACFVMFTRAMHGPLYHVHHHHLLDLCLFLPFAALVVFVSLRALYTQPVLMAYNLVGVMLAWWGIAMLRTLNDRLERSRFVVSYLSGTFRRKMEEELVSLRAVLVSTIPPAIATEVIESVRGRSMFVPSGAPHFNGVHDYFSLHGPPPPHTAQKDSIPKAEEEKATFPSPPSSPSPMLNEKTKLGEEHRSQFNVPLRSLHWNILRRGDRTRPTNQQFISAANGSQSGASNSIDDEEEITTTRGGILFEPLFLMTANAARSSSETNGRLYRPGGVQNHNASHLPQVPRRTMLLKTLLPNQSAFFTTRTADTPLLVLGVLPPCLRRHDGAAAKQMEQWAQSMVTTQPRRRNLAAEKHPSLFEAVLDGLRQLGLPTALQQQETTGNAVPLHAAHTTTTTVPLPPAQSLLVPSGSDESAQSSLGGPAVSALAHASLALQIAMLWDDIRLVLDQYTDLVIAKSSGDVCTVGCRLDTALQFPCFLYAIRSLYSWLMVPWQRQQFGDSGLRLRAALVYGPVRGAVLGTSALSFEYFGEAVSVGVELVRNPPMEEYHRLPTLIVAQERFLQQAVLQIAPLTSEECAAHQSRDVVATLAQSPLQMWISESPQQWKVAGRQGNMFVRPVMFAPE